MDSVGPATRELRVGEWWVRPLQNEVERGGDRLHLEARSIDVLLCLARRAPAVVSKESILGEVWAGIAVGDEVVSHAIWELRKSFGDDARRQEYIRTVPKKGYALVAEVFWSVGGVEPQPGTAVGPYRLEEEIGRGAMGLVYRAVDTRLQRTVAIKFLAAELTRDLESVRRFEREARLAASLDHPNLAPVFEVGEMSGGRQFLVMAYCAGGTLRDRLAKGTLGPREALEIIAQIGRGLAVAHRKGIIHRDVKPANILFTEDGTARLVDFGIAKLAADTSLTRTGHSLGTPAYKSPEQSRGISTDHRTDIWSLGVVLYECLTGTRPFSGSFEHAVVRSILEDEPNLMPSLLDSASTPGLEAILGKALAKRPEDRYETASQMVAEIEACLGLTVATRHSSSSRRVWLLASALVALGILVGLWFATFSGRRIARATEARVRQFLDNGWLAGLRGLKEEGTRQARENFMAAYLRNASSPEVMGSLAYSLTLGLGDRVRDEKDRSDARDLVERARTFRFEHGLLLVAEARLAMFDEKERLALLSDAGKDVPTTARYVKAIQLAKRAIEEFSQNDPNRDLAYITLARAYELAGLADLALETYEQSIHYGRGGIRGRENLAWILAGRGDRDRAASLYQEILDIEQNHLAALQNLGMLYIDMGRSEDAAFWLRRAFVLHEDARIANALGEAYFFQDGRNHEACDYFRRALRLDPAYANALNGLGDCILVEGDLDGARENWLSALGLYSSDHIRPELNLREKSLKAVVLAKLGRCSEAMAVDVVEIGAPIELEETFFHRAQVHALCGTRSDVVELARLAAKRNYPRRVFRVDPRFAKFQGDAEFEAALEGN